MTIPRLAAASLVFLRAEIPARALDPLYYTGALFIMVSPTFDIVSGSWLHMLSLMVCSSAVVLVASLILAGLRWWLIGNFVDSIALLLVAQLLHAATFGTPRQPVPLTRLDGHVTNLAGHGMTGR